MAAKADIESIVSTLLPAPAFFFGTEDEFNTAVDDIDLTNGVFFMYALQQVGFQTTNSNAISNTVSIFVAMLYKNEFDADNSAQCEPLDFMAISMLNQFLVRLSNYRGSDGAKVYKRNVGDKTKPRAVRFNYADTNLYGRSFALDLATFKNDKICY